MNLLTIPIAHAAVDMTLFGKAINPIISNVVYPIIGLLFATAVVVFVWGVLQLVIHSADADGRDEAKKSIMYGVIGIFIMVSAWGIIQVISNTLKSDIGSGTSTTNKIDPFTNQ